VSDKSILRPVVKGDLPDLLERDRSLILDRATASMSRLQLPHYAQIDGEQVRAWLEGLFDHVADAAERRDLSKMIGFAQQIAEERFHAGFDLSEVQVAFNTLEESMWARVLACVEPEQLGEALGLVGTILGCGKDALARRYVSLAAERHLPSLNLRALLAGGDGA
jgi:hypothetical protein